MQNDAESLERSLPMYRQHYICFLRQKFQKDISPTSHDNDDESFTLHIQILRHNISAHRAARRERIKTLLLYILGGSCWLSLFKTWSILPLLRSDNRPENSTARVKTHGRSRASISLAYNVNYYRVSWLFN